MGHFQLLGYVELLLGEADFVVSLAPVTGSDLAGVDSIDVDLGGEDLGGLLTVLVVDCPGVFTIEIVTSDDLSLPP